MKQTMFILPEHLGLILLHFVKDILRCSDYLVSGVHGVEDSSLSVSSILPTDLWHTADPQNARLFYPGDDFSTPKKAGAWVTYRLDTEQFIQDPKGCKSKMVYKEAQGGAILYEVIEVRRDQSYASAACATQGTRLMKVDSVSKMTSLMNVITGRPALSNDFRFYVSGVYDSQTSSYVDGIAMTSTLWAPTNPDPTHGHCTMLTRTGLASVDCQQHLYSICGN